MIKIGAGMENSYKYFENKECEYYPCHKEKQNLNCMFCYCPFYSHAKCPGNAMYVEVEGKKIKTNLRLPAKEVTYLRYIMDSHFIPVNGHIKKAKKGFKVEIKIA